LITFIQVAALKYKATISLDLNYQKTCIHS